MPLTLEQADLAADRRPPGWLDLVVRSVALAIVALGLVGLPLALLGEFRRLPIAVGTGVVFLGLTLLWQRGRPVAPARPVGRTATVLGLLAVLVALTSGVVNGAQHYSHLVVDGDPAVYLATGTLLANTGALTVPTQAGALFADNPTIGFAGPGYYPTEGAETIYPQFFHLLPVLVAVADWVGGLGLVLLVNPILGAFSLLAFFAFAARVVRPGWALLAMTTLAVLLPQLHFSRDAFSEILSQLLVFAGLALLWDLTGPRRDRPSRGGRFLAGGLVAGLVLGGSTMARIDAFLYLVPIAAALILLRTGRTGLAVLAGAAVPAGVALVDGYLGSPIYLGSVRGQLLQTGAVLALVGVAAVVVRRQPAWPARLGVRLAWPVTGLLVALAAFAWFVRPSVQISRDIPERTFAALMSFQRREGLTVDVPRSYDELTMLWLQWYLGPVTLALGTAGLAYLTFRLLRGRDLRLAPFVLVVALATAVYVWKPGIFPVQYWASRRFLPVSFPGLILLTLLLADRVWAWRSNSRLVRAGTRPVVAGLAATVLIFPLALLPGAVLPRSYDGLGPAFDQICGSLLDDDVVLLIGAGAAGSGLPQAVQAYCGVPTGEATEATGAADVLDVAAAVHAAGRRLVLLSPVPEPAGMPAGTAFRSIVDVTVPTPALTLASRPDQVFPLRFQLFHAVL